MDNSEKHTSNVIQTDIPKSAHVDTYKHAHMNMKENRQWRKYLRSNHRQLAKGFCKSRDGNRDSSLEQ